MEDEEICVSVEKIEPPFWCKVGFHKFSPYVNFGKPKVMLERYFFGALFSGHDNYVEFKLQPQIKICERCMSASRKRTIRT